MVDLVCELDHRRVGHPGGLGRGGGLLHRQRLGAHQPRLSALEVDARVEAPGGKGDAADEDDQGGDGEPPAPPADEVEGRLAPVQADEDVVPLGHRSVAGRCTLGLGGDLELGLEVLFEDLLGGSLAVRDRAVVGCPVGRGHVVRSVAIRPTRRAVAGRPWSAPRGLIPAPWCPPRARWPRSWPGSRSGCCGARAG